MCHDDISNSVTDIFYDFIHLGPVAVGEVHAVAQKNWYKFDVAAFYRTWTYFLRKR